jgi:hypothetical protein
MKTTERELTEEERSFLMHVLSHGSESARSFVAQLPVARAVGGCTCGCPSIGLVVNQAAVKGYATERVVVDLIDATPDGLGVGVLVFADAGYLSELEIYDFDAHVKPFPLPTIESLRPFETNQP